MSEDISNTDAPKLLPYFLILFGMSAGLSSVITLGAEFKQELGFSNFEIGFSAGHHGSVRHSDVMNMHLSISSSQCKHLDTES